MSKQIQPKSLLFRKMHEEAKKGVKKHMERERLEHEAQIQKVKNKRDKR